MFSIDFGILYAESPPYFYFRFVRPTGLESTPHGPAHTPIISTKFTIHRGVKAFLLQLQTDHTTTVARGRIAIDCIFALCAWPIIKQTQHFMVLSPRLGCTDTGTVKLDECTKPETKPKPPRMWVDQQAATVQHHQLLLVLSLNDNSHVIILPLALDSIRTELVTHTHTKRERKLFCETIYWLCCEPLWTCEIINYSKEVQATVSWVISHTYQWPIHCKYSNTNKRWKSLLCFHRKTSIVLTCSSNDGWAEVRRSCLSVVLASRWRVITRRISFVFCNQQTLLLQQLWQSIHIIPLAVCCSWWLLCTAQFFSDFCSKIQAQQMHAKLHPRSSYSFNNYTIDHQF